MKKITTIILALLMCMLLTVPAFAGTALNIRVGNAECAAGETATVTVSLENNPGITYLSLSIVCDSTFAVSKATNGNIISSMTSGRQYVWSCDENASGNGVLLTLQINVPSTAVAKDYPISVTVRGCNNYDEEDVVTNVISGTITVKCAHAHTENHTEQPATCKDIGYTAGVYCKDCKTYISGHEIIPTTNDHNYGTWTKDNATNHKHTCSVCGKSETSTHTWDSGKISREATHTVAGEKVYTCTICGATKTEAIDPNPLPHTFGAWTNVDETNHKRTCACGETETSAHTWDSGKVTTQPTCKDKGIKTYTCVCGETKTEEVPATYNHNYGTWTKDNATNHKHTCSVCGKSETSAHTWDSGKISREATHTVAGEKVYTCTICGATKTEAIDPNPLPHTFGAWTSVDETNHKRTCACGETETAAHTWDSGKVTTQPTCKDKGVKTYTCTACSTTKTEEIPPTNDHNYGTWTKDDATNHKRTCSVCGKIETSAHTWDSGKVTTQPTCKDKGVKTYTCTVCSATKTEEIPKTDNHNYGAWAKDDATNHKHTCSVCGKIETSAHTWDSGKVTTQPTCKDKGVKTYTCVCGETKTAEVPTTNNHKYGAWAKDDATNHKRTCSVCGKSETSAHTWDKGQVTTQPTCKGKGIKTYTCTICGAAKTEEVPTTNDHKYGDWIKVDSSNYKRTCSICGKIETSAHTWDAGTIIKAGSCTEDKIIKYICTLCGFEKTETISAPGHTIVTDAAVAATCTETGLTSGSHCSACNTVIMKQEIIPASGHIPGTEATCTEAQKCTACGVVLAEAKGHSFGTWISVSDMMHKRVCACGAEETSAHAFDGGRVTKEATKEDAGVRLYTCSCGATKTETFALKAENIADAGSGVKIDGDSNALPNGTVMNVEKAEKSEITKVYESVKETLVEIGKNAEIIDVFDITLENAGAEIQPNGTIKVTLPMNDPIPSGKSATVVHIADDGTTTPCVTTCHEDGTISFVTDHFSRYAIVLTDAIAENGIVEFVSGNFPICIGAIVLLIAAVTIVCVIIKKKRKSS